jgi:hypothetical protein
MDYVQDIANTKERKGTETAKLTEKRKKKKHCCTKYYTVHVMIHIILK